MEILKEIQKEENELQTLVKDWGLPKLENFIEELIKKDRAEQLILSGVVNCVYVVTERDNYGEQLFRQVFSNKEQAFEYLAENGLKESNVYEINEIELK